LAISIEHTTSIHIHILTAELEEGGSILESLVEGVGLPVVCVIGELNIALDV
jgi:RNA-binding protein YhbY